MNKGMPIWERHIEKIVLALTIVVLLTVFSMFVLGSNAITADIDGRQYGPSEVNAELTKRAGELEMKLGGGGDVDVSAFENIRSSGADGFRDRLAASIGPSGSPPRIAPALATVLLPEGMGSVDVWYHEPRIAAPVIRDQVAQAIDTIDPSEFTRVPELSSSLGGDPDVSWTTPMATLDLTALRDELEASDSLSSPPRESIPSNWYNNRPYILDVVFERQARGRDGTWSEASVVESLPGGLGLRALLAQKRADDELDAGFKEAVWLNLDERVKQLEILQPDFYATLNSSSALILETEEEMEESQDELANDDEDAARRQQERTLNNKITQKQNSRNRIISKLEELGGPLDESEIEDEDRGGSGDRGRGGGGGGGGGGFVDPGGGGAGMGQGGQGRKSGGGMGNAANRSQRLGLTKRMKSLEREIERLLKQLEDLNPEAVVDDSSEEVVELPDLALEEQILIWTHDIGVEAGNTYRYRCRVLLFNPFFARGRLLLDEQAHLEESFEIASAASDWSKPVTVAPPVEFFVVRASDTGGSMGLGEARVELYRYEDGARRSQQFSVQPGERIGRSVNVNGTRVDFETDWYLVDVIDDPSAGGAGVDREDDATVVCRRLDGTEMRIRVPSRQLVDPQRNRLRVDADGARG